MSPNPQPPPPNRVKRIFLVDDYPMVRNGVAELIRKESDLEICGESDTAEQAMRALTSTPADLIIVDLSLAGRSGLELIKDLRARYPELLILVLSMHAEQLYAERALHAGANGYIMKTASEEALIKAIRKVLDGQVYVSEKISRAILEDFAGRASTKELSPVMQLSDREFEVFHLIGQGKATHEIALQLGVSPKTVNTHRAHIYEKLQLEKGVDLTYYAVSWLQTNQGPLL
jgi:DNA-binding NarL/FixJ family response regulator